MKINNINIIKAISKVLENRTRRGVSVESLRNYILHLMNETCRNMPIVRKKIEQLAKRKKLL